MPRTRGSPTPSEYKTPSLRADRIAAGLGGPARQLRPAAVALARYQLRAAGRPTPFGLFAGVARARFGGSALARFGEAHRAAARCDAAWLLSVIVGDYRPEDIDLREGAGVAIQAIADLPGLKVTPFVRRAIESHLLPVLADRL